MNKFGRNYEEKLNIINQIHRNIKNMKNQAQRLLNKNSLQLPPIMSLNHQSITKNHTTTSPKNYRYLYNSNGKVKHNTSAKIQPSSSKQIGYHQISFHNLNQQPQRKLIFTKAVNPRITIRRKMNSTLNNKLNSQDKDQKEHLDEEVLKKYHTVDYSYPEKIKRAQRSLLVSQRFTSSDLNGQRKQYQKFVEQADKLEQPFSIPAKIDLDYNHEKKLMIESIYQKKKDNGKIKKKYVQKYSPWQSESPSEDLYDILPHCL